MSGSALFAQACLPENLVNTVLKKQQQKTVESCLWLCLQFEQLGNDSLTLSTLGKHHENMPI